MNEALNACIVKNKDQMVEALARIVKIPSKFSEPCEGAPFGKPAKEALECAMQIGRELGFETVVNVNDQTCYIEYGSGSKVVGVFAHLDIVEEGEGWTYPPYGGEVHNNRLYGRGTVDNKGPFMASLFALKAIKELGIDLGDCRIRVVGGTYEELGMADMKDYVATEGAPDAGFTPDGIYPMSFTERGINYYTMKFEKTQEETGSYKVVSLNGGRILNMVPDKASAVLEAKTEEDAKTLADALATYCETTGQKMSAAVDGRKIEIASTGLCAHSCTPFNGKNAIVQILMFLAQNNPGGSMGDFLNMFVEKIGMTTDGSLMGMKREDECGKLTFSLSKMDIDEKEINWIVNIRLPYTYKDEVTPDFKAQMEPAGNVFTKVDAHPTYMYPKDSNLIKTLRAVYEDMTGKDSTPGYEAGTYAQVVPNIVPFGSIWPDTPDLCHRPDENVSLDEYVLNAQIFGHAMVALAHSLQKD